MPLHLGGSKVSKMFLGSAEVTAAYLGAQQVHSGVSPPFDEQMLEAAPEAWWTFESLDSGGWTVYDVMSNQALSGYWGAFTTTASTPTCGMGINMGGNAAIGDSGWTPLDHPLASVEFLLRIPGSVGSFTVFETLIADSSKSGFVLNLTTHSHVVGATGFRLDFNTGSGIKTFTWNVGPPFLDGGWHHVALSPFRSGAGGETANLWVDGVKFATTLANNDYQPLGMPIVLGNDLSGATRGWHIDELATFHRRLTDSEVASRAEAALRVD